MIDGSFPADEGFGKVDGQFMHTRWWLQTPILDAHTLLHFGQTKVWVEHDSDAARSPCLLRFFLAASCLSASNLQLAFLSDKRHRLGLMLPAAMTDD